MTDRPPELTAEIVEAIARRTAELVLAELSAGPAPDAPGRGLVDAATLAEHLGVARDFVYEHADALGAVRLGDGPRARLRFDVERATAAVAATRDPEPPPASPTRRRPARPAGPGGVLRVRGTV